MSRGGFSGRGRGGRGGGAIDIPCSWLRCLTSNTPSGRGGGSGGFSRPGFDAGPPDTVFGPNSISYSYYNLTVLIITIIPDKREHFCPPWDLNCFVHLPC